VNQALATLWRAITPATDAAQPRSLDSATAQHPTCNLQ